MADKVVTPANVLASTNASKLTGTAGAAITAGQVVYLNSTTNTIFPAIANAATLQTPIGIALNSAAAGQPISYTASDTAFTPGYATSVGETTYLSAGTAGNVTLFANLPTGQTPGVQPVIIFLGTGTASAALSIVPAKVTF
jgi:hypothetical protein